MKKLADIKCRWFAGEKTPAKALFLVNLKECQGGWKKYFIVLVMLFCATLVKGQEKTVSMDGPPIKNPDSVWAYQQKLILNIPFENKDTINYQRKRKKCHCGINPENAAYAESYYLSPNPNDAIIAFNYKLAPYEHATFGIYNLQGKSIKKYTLDINNNRISVDQNQLAAGEYYWGVKVNGKLVKTDKLTIIK